MASKIAGPSGETLFDADDGKEILVLVMSALFGKCLKALDHV